MKQIASLWLTWSLLSGSAVAQGWGPVVQISTAPNGRAQITAEGITTDDSQRIHIVWQDARDGNREIYYRRSSDGGQSWGTETRLTNDTGYSAWPAVATGPGGGVHMVWWDDRDTLYGSNIGEVFYKRSTDGGGSWLPDTRLTREFWGKGYPNVVVGLNNQVDLLWEGQYYGQSQTNVLYYMRSSDGGATWGPDTALTRPPQYTLSQSFASAKQGRLHLTWDGRSNGPFDSSRVFYCRSTDGGVTWDTVRQLNTSLFQAHSPSVSADSQGFVYCAWMDKRNRRGEIYFRRSPDGGISWDSEVTLATSPDNDYVWPSVTAGSRGEVGVGYYWLSSDQRIIGVAYRHSADRGMTWGPEELVSDTIAHWVGSVSTAMDSFGRAHVAWSDSTASLGYWAVYYRRRNAGVGVETNPPSRLTPYPSRLTVSPNPFTSFTTLPGHTSERFALYDVSGRLVGNYKGDQVGEGLSAGVYFLRPEGKDAKPLRIIKLR